MTLDKTITINDAYDVISARMQVREAARNHGMGLTDQACISMATSSVANNMISLDKPPTQGSITIERLSAGGKIGIRVTCQWKGLSEQDLPYGNERWMVDEIDTREGQDHSLEVVLTKWAVSRTGL